MSITEFTLTKSLRCHYSRYSFTATGLHPISSHPKARIIPTSVLSSLAEMGRREYMLAYRRRTIIVFQAFSNTFSVTYPVPAYCIKARL